MNQTTEAEQEIKEHTRKPQTVAIFLALLALLSPIGIQITVYGGAFSVLVMSLFYGLGFTESATFFNMITQEHLLFALILMSPRFASAIQMHQYYQGKSNRRVSLFAAIGSESTGLLLILPSMISILFFPFIILPLPLILVSCVLMLWLSPRPEPETPWDENIESTSWLDKDSEQ